MPRNKIKEVCRELQEALGLTAWRLSYKWFDEDQEGEQIAAASMRSTPEYFEMQLGIYPRFFKEAESHQFEMLLHEFSHVLTEELYQTARAFSQGKNYHPETLEMARERNTTMTHLALLNLIASSSHKLGKIYKKLNHVMKHKV